MPDAAQMEVRSILGREVKIRWKSARHQEWLAWCYLPGPSMLPNEGVGFEARAESPEAAKNALVEKVQAHLARTARDEVHRETRAAGCHSRDWQLAIPFCLST